MKINYDGRRFRAVVNSPNGQVGATTFFEYHQDGDNFHATYSGGQILQGHMIGKVREDGIIDFVYHHIDTGSQLKSGHCRSVPEVLPDGKIRLHETWQWDFGGEGNGESIVEEM